MPKLVQKSGYLKAGKAGGYMRYIATREHMEKLEGNGSVTKGQKKLIQNLLKDFPDTTACHEYDDYAADPTFGNALALITMALDMNADEVQDRKGYMEYISTRPRVERHGEHGLFSNTESVSLDAALRELEGHDGNVWTLIWSLRREDAARLGYDNAAAWRTLIRGKQVELATAMKIPPDKFRWYAVFHDEGIHPHVHAMVWSDDLKQGYLTSEGIAKMQSTLTNEIFRDELLQIYQEKDRSYKEITQVAREAMRDLIRELKENLCGSPEAERQLMELSMSLTSAKGKKQYQYLKKTVKKQVDKIVDTIAALPQVAECYEAWNILKDELDDYYHDAPRERLSMSQQKEFRALKNMVIREADDLRLGVMTFADEGMADEPDNEETFPRSGFRRMSARRNCSMMTACPMKIRRKPSMSLNSLRIPAARFQCSCWEKHGVTAFAARHGMRKRKNGSNALPKPETIRRSMRWASCCWSRGVMSRVSTGCWNPQTEETGTPCTVWARRRSKAKA